MAILQKTLSNITGSDEAARKSKELLEILLEAANNRIKSFKDEIIDIYTDPRKQDFLIIGKRLAAEEYDVRISVKNDSSFKDGMKGVISSFFQGTEESVKKGFQDLLTGALDAFLINTEIGEKTFSKFSVITEYHAIIRVDIRLWQRTFLQTGVFGQQQNVLVYYMSKSIVDHRKLTLDELTYYMSQMAGPNANLDTVKSFIIKIKEIWHLLDPNNIVPIIDNYSRMANLV
jgi:hypothetical protein